MSAKKKADSCWTCRLRRKKCDKLRPECGVCKSLEIHCYFDVRKPEWMINRGEQREMIEKIKYQVKQKAAVRRERNQATVGSAMNGVNRKTAKGAFVVKFESDVLHSNAIQMGIGSPEQHTSNANQHAPSLQSSYCENPFDFHHRIGPSSSQPRSRSVPETLDYSICSSLFSKASDFEIDFITKYLDYVFPSLFPFYRPAIFETGRSWLLSLLRRNRIAFHSAVGLTSYFVAIALRDAYGDNYADCTGELWDRLEKQTDSFFEGIHTDMLDLNLRVKTATVLEKVYVMESIIHILMFEAVLARSADWNLHLTAAFSLFEDVFSEADSFNSKMVSVLHSIGMPLRYKAEYDHYIWSPDQAGFRFFAALLIFVDIIASTALAQPPRLSVYHSGLLANQDDGAPILGFSRLRLSAVVGCQNSVIVAIGQIAALYAWKQSMKQEGNLAMAEVIERAAPISTSLNSVLATLDATEILQRPQPLNLPFQSYAVRSGASASAITVNRIWSYAAQVYLGVVVSGWQPSNIEICDGISRIIELLPTVPSNHLRTLAWPLCVAGCLASVNQEQEFRNVFTTKKEIELVGSLSEARRVMEKVWESRKTVNTERWDLATCFCILGKPVLLV